MKESAMDGRISGGTTGTQNNWGDDPHPRPNRRTGIYLTTLHGQPIWRLPTRQRSDERDENKAENNTKKKT